MTRAAGFVTQQRAVEWAAVVAGFVVVHFVGRPTGWLGWLILVLAGLLVAAPVILAAHREYLRENEAAAATDLATNYRARLGVALSDTIIPIADLIGRINAARGEERARLQAQLVQGTVDAAAALCGGDRTRVAFLLLDGDLLRPEAWSGRAEPPQPILAAGDAARRVGELARYHGRLLIPDVAEGRAPLGIKARDGYRSLIVVVVAAGGRDIGLLLADAPGPGELEDNDLDLIATLGQLLGAGLAAGLPRRSYGRRVSTSPA